MKLLVQSWFLDRDGVFMKGLFLKFFVFGFFIFLLFSPVVQGSESQDLTQDVEEVANIWPRMAGTEGEEEIIGFLEDEFSSIGVSTDVENFALENGYVFESGSLETDVGEEIEFAPMMRSPSVDNLRAELEHVENFQEEGDMEGKIVLTSYKNFPEVFDYNPEAVILYRENYPAWSEVRSVEVLEVPTVTVSYEDIGSLSSVSEEGREVVLSLDGYVDDLESKNFIATISGEIDESIVVATHHDTLFSPGAVDSGSGISVMLEVARRVRNKNLEKTVEFVSFGAEKYDSRGAEHYLENVGWGEIAGVLNVNSISGSEDGLKIGVEGFSDRWLDRFVKRTADDLEISYSGGAGFEENYAYMKFVDEFLPATRIFWPSAYEDPFWMVDTVEDDVRFVEENNLKTSADLVEETVYRIGEPWGDGWRWGHDFPGVFALFVVLSLAFVVVGIGIFSYFRYVRGYESNRVVLSVLAGVLVAILVLFLAMF